MMIDVDRGTNMATWELTVWVLLPDCFLCPFDQYLQSMDGHSLAKYGCAYLSPDIRWYAGYYQVLRHRQHQGKYSVIPNIEVVPCPSNMMILGRGTHSSYVGIGSHVRLPPANQKLLFLFICDAKIRIV